MMFQKLGLFLSSGEGRKMPTVLGPLESANLSDPQVQCLRLALSKGPNRVGIFLPSPEDGNRSSF
jgi:hypothetical protein